MNVASTEELIHVTGGAKYGIIFGILAFGIMVVGIIDGFLRPYKCR